MIKANNKGQTQFQTQIISQDQCFAARLNFQSVILLCRRILHLLKIRQYSNEELIGQSFTYLPKNLKHEELSLVDACYSFDNFTNQDLKGTNITVIFQQISKEFRSANYPFINHCLDLTEMAFNNKSSIGDQKRFYNELYTETERRHKVIHDPNRVPTQEQAMNTVQNILGQKHVTSQLFSNQDSEMSKYYTRDIHKYEQTDKGMEIELNPSQSPIFTQYKKSDTNNYMKLIITITGKTPQIKSQIPKIIQDYKLQLQFEDEMKFEKWWYNTNSNTFRSQINRENVLEIIIKH